MYIEVCLFSCVATLLYAVYENVYVLGGGRGSSGPSQENFEMKWYKSCKSVQNWIIHQEKMFLPMLLSVRVTVHQFFGMCYI